MLTKKIVFIAQLLLPLCAFSQFTEKITSARPGFANGPFSVGKRIYQVQTGFSFVNKEFNNGSYNTQNNVLSQSGIFRIGIFDKTEFRLGYSYNIRDYFVSKETIAQTTFQSKSTKLGFSNFTIGLRQLLIEQQGLVPAIGIQISSILGGFNEYRKSGKDYNIRLLLQHKLNNKLVLNTNLSSNHSLDEVAYNFHLTCVLTQQVRIIGELYGSKYFEDTNFRNDISRNYLIGIGYLFTNDFQFDFFGSYGHLSNQFSSFTFNAGISYRINKRD